MTSLLLLLAIGCDATSTVADDPACDPLADADSDGLDDCTELEQLGTDPNLADTDGDGHTDSAELDCVSDPLDGEQICYACGWEHSDPGDLDNVGPEVGDTIGNLRMGDQCGEQVPLWDLAGQYWILFMTAAW